MFKRGILEIKPNFVIMLLIFEESRSTINITYLGSLKSYTIIDAVMKYIKLTSNSNIDH